MKIGKNLILAALILNLSLFTGLSADRKSVDKKYPGTDIGEKFSVKRSVPFSHFGNYFFLSDNNYIYWLSPDIITDIEAIIKKKKQGKRKSRPGNIKQMFSIMHL